MNLHQTPKKKCKPLFFLPLYISMEAEDSAIEMGKRPSRQRRHLPTSVTSAVASRSSTTQKQEYKQNMPLLKMSFREKDPVDLHEDFGSSTAYNNRSSNSNRLKSVRQ
jgi:hypothetical protein